MTEHKQTQLDKFKEAAREHGADEDEGHWDERLRRVAKSASAPSAEASEATKPQVGRAKDAPRKQ